MLRVFTTLVAAVVPALGFYNANSNVVTLTPSNFNKEVIKSDAVWIVEFYAPWCGHCKALTPEFTKLADATVGVAKVGAVDADQHKSLGGQYGVQGFPTLKIFGVDKQKPKDYQGQRTAQGMADELMREAKASVTQRLNGGKSSGSKSSGSKNKKSGGSGSAGKGAVIELTESNFDKLVTESSDSFLVSFTAPWCGHCKNLKPAWREAAQKMAGKVKFGDVDATAHTNLAQRFGVNGYPTLKSFSGSGPGRKSGKPYEGGRTAEDLIQFASTLAPPAEVRELLNPKDFEDCDDEVCIVAFVPELYDGGASERKRIIKILQKVCKDNVGPTLSWFWAAPGQQQSLQDSLMRGSTAFPGVFAVNQAKKVAAVMRSGLDEKNLAKFVINLSTGKLPTQQFAGKLEIVKAEKWDGKDAVVEEFEEISLDDLFGDDDDDKDEL